MKIKRQSIFNQITHLGIMISVFALIFSGILQMPVAKRYMIYKLPLMSWSVDYYISLMVHYIFSISLIFFVFLHITYYILRKDFSMLPKKGDIKKSIKLIYAIIFNKEEEPCEKYLPEQRLAYLGLVIIMAVLIITGLIKTYKNLAGISISENSIFLIALLHNIGMFLMIFWIFIHLFAFVFKTNRALLGAMFGGKVDAKYVLKRHKLWHEGVKAAKNAINKTTKPS